MKRFKEIFSRARPALIGMVHLDPLPGSPKYGGSVNKVVEKALKETEIYKNSGIDGLMLENMHDVPYLKPTNLGPEVVAVMTRVVTEIKQILPKTFPVGVQILAGANKEAVAVACACQLDFVRVEGFVFGHVADEGLFDACAGPLTRYRANLNSSSVLLWTDIKKKHCSHAITADLSIEEVARAAQFFMSDGVIVTGSATGCPADVDELKRVKQAVDLPVLVGSGVTLDNLNQFKDADALIVGSYFKKNGLWREELVEDRVKEMVHHLEALR